MADETVAQTGENSQPAAAASPSAEAQNTVATPPAEEHSAANSGSENRIPQGRFNEVIEQRNRERQLREQYEAKIRELEARQPGHGDASQALVKRMMDKLDVSEEAAKEFINIQREAARLEKADVETRLRQYEVQSWSDSLAQKHKDYRELLPSMEKAFNDMSDHEQLQIVSSPKALEMFYKSVRADALEKKLQENYNKGANDAYQNKGAKAAMSSVPGSSASQPSTKLSREALAKMPIDEYKKRLPEINAWLQSGAK